MQFEGGWLRLRCQDEKMSIEEPETKTYRLHNTDYYYCTFHTLFIPVCSGDFCRFHFNIKVYGTQFFSVRSNYLKHKSVFKESFLRSYPASVCIVQIRILI